MSMKYTVISGKDAEQYTIRRYQPGDEYAIADVICKTLMESNSKDYPPDIIQENINEHSPRIISERANGTQHMYVVCDGDMIVGCGAIDGYWGSTTESYLMSIFVLPKYQGKRIGSKIISVLESDNYFKRAWRTEVGSSLTAVEFYRRMGYTFKNGITTPDEFHVVRLEKYNEACHNGCEVKEC